MSTGADALGRRGEAAAEAYLTGLGMRTIARRYRGGDGEIDLIMEDGDTLVFVEVKATVRGGRGAGMCRVDRRKQQRLIHAGQAFLLEREWMERPARFDVVEITAAGLYHVPCAFEAGGWS